MRTERLVTAALSGAVAVGGTLLLASARPRPLPAHRSSGDPPPLPEARVIAVPGRGELFLRDTDPQGRLAAAGVDHPPVLLLHGWMFPADLNWFPAFGPLSEDARVLAPDHRGHGRGSRPSRPFRLVDVADDVAALLRHLGTGPVIAVGYSMGGPVSQLLWQRHPDLVAGLVQCATSATFTARPRDRYVWRLMGALQLALRLLPRHWLEAGALAQAQGRLPVRLSRLITDDTPEELLDLIPWIVGELDRSSAEDVAEAGRELGRYDARGWVGSVDVPSAVVITEHDQLVPARNQEDLAKRLPSCVTIPIPADHDAAGRPEIFVPALRKAINAVVDARQHAG